jgi:hypothetical protein
MKLWRKGTYSESDDKEKEASEWDKGDRSVLAPVASGTVDTGERVGIDRWSIAWLTLTTHLTLSVVRPTHYFIGVVWFNNKADTIVFSCTSELTRTKQKSTLATCYTVAFVQPELIGIISALDDIIESVQGADAGSGKIDLPRRTGIIPTASEHTITARYY